MTEIEKWEDTMADSHKGAKIAGPKDRKRTASRSLSCNWEECDKQCKTLAGLKAHQRRIHSKNKETRRTCEKCQQSFSDHQARVNHGKICQGQEKGTCPYCQKRLLPSNMARHKKTLRRDRKRKNSAPYPKCRKKRSNVLSAAPGSQDQTWRDTRDSTEVGPKQEGTQAPRRVSC